MANNEVLIPIPGRLHSVATEGHVAGADEIYDDTKAVTQDVINASVLEEKAYVPADYSGMGRVVLKKNMVSGVNTLTQAMMPIASQEGEEDPGKNTIYVIQYDFTLGEDITVPANCVLEFDGGALNGSNKVTFTNTQLIGNPIILCDYDGTLYNDNVDISWFGAKENDSAFDNGNIIAKVLNTFKRGSLYGDTYYFSTPIVISNFTDKNHKIELYCKLIYIGSDNTTAITFDYIHNCNIRLDDLNSNTNIKNCTAIKITSAKQNIIDTGYIHGFKYGVVIQPTLGGNVSNTYIFREFCCNGDCTHLTLDSSQGGYVNDNRFKDSYFGKLSGTSDLHIKGVHIIGPSNCNVFNNFSFEWCEKCIILENTSNNVFNDIRTENCSNIVTSIGKSLDNRVFALYNSNSSYPFVSFEDNSQATYNWGCLTLLRSRNIEKYIPINKNIKEYIQKVSTYNAGANIDVVRLKGYWFDNFTSSNFNTLSNTIRCTVHDNGIELPYSGYVSIVIDANKSKLFNIVKQFTAAEAKLHVRYLEKNGTALLTNSGEDIPLSDGLYYYDSDKDAFVVSASSLNITSVRIPDEITKVEFAIRDFGILQVFDVLGIDGPTYKITGDINILDDRSNVVLPPIGQMLFENGQPIYWNGTAWVDATGTPV